MEFEVTTQRLADGVALVHVVGELDLYTVPHFERALADAAAGSHGVVVDLTHCDFLDSTAVLALATAGRQSGARLRLVIPNGLLMRVFEITGFMSSFEFATSMEAAAPTAAHV